MDAVLFLWFVQLLILFPIFLKKAQPSHTWAFPICLKKLNPHTPELFLIFLKKVQPSKPEHPCPIPPKWMEALTDSLNWYLIGKIISILHWSWCCIRDYQFSVLLIDFKTNSLSISRWRKHGIIVCGQYMGTVSNQVSSVLLLRCFYLQFLFIVLNVKLLLHGLLLLLFMLLL